MIILITIISCCFVSSESPRVCGTCPASRRDTFSAVVCGWRSSAYQCQAVLRRKVGVGDNSPREIRDWGESLRCGWKTTWMRSSPCLRLGRLLDWRESRRKRELRMVWIPIVHLVESLFLFPPWVTAKDCQCYPHLHSRPILVLGWHWYCMLAVLLTPWRQWRVTQVRLKDAASEWNGLSADKETYQAQKSTHEFCLLWCRNFRRGVCLLWTWVESDRSGHSPWRGQLLQVSASVK